MILDILPKKLEAQNSSVFSNVQRGAFPFLVQEILQAKKEKTPLVVVCSDRGQLDQLASELTYLEPPRPVHTFPEWNTIPYDRVSPDRDIMAQRVKTLSALMHDTGAFPGLVLTTFRALFQKVVRPQDFSFQQLTLKPGLVLKFQKLLSFLSEQGLERVDVVREPGSYAVRGGIIDLFPLGEDLPVRVDFFDEEIETLKTFDPMSQRTLDVCSEVVLGSGAELVISSEKANAFRIRYLQHFGVESGKDELVQQLMAGGHPVGIEQWLPFFYEGLACFFDYFPEKTTVLSYGSLSSGIKDLHQQASEYYVQRIEDLKEYEKNKKSQLMTSVYRPVPVGQFYLTEQQVMESASSFQVLESFPHDHPGAIDLKTRRVLLDDKKPFPSLFQAVQRFDGQTIFSAFSQKQIEQIKSGMKSQEDFLFVEKESLRTALKGKYKKEAVYGVVAPFSFGFQGPTVQLITYQDLFGVGRSGVQRAQKSLRLVSLQDLNAYEEGDFLVHREHGVGRFFGLVSLSLEKADHECVALEYDDGNKLYVPVENLDVLTKYAGKDSEATLDRLGTAHWQKRAAKVKEKLFEVAESLMALAAQRAISQDTGFQVDFPEYQEFCAQFPYVETADQQSAIQHVEEDLASARPMDRLVCGDVGFGKTEVAMRAAFLAAMNGGQVLMLVPTTVLCQQHTQNFLKRFDGFSLKIGHLSRFTKPKERKEALENLKNGSLQILIATHGVFSKSVQFKKLSLIIVDEEQHFGVMQKEYLKNLQPNVNILAMSATPIPRTLQLAVAGVRGLSLIASAPVDRMAVKSQVMPFDTMVVREAIMREVQRGGQVYFVCPRLKDLDKMQETLKRIVPDVSFGVAHGQLSTQELDQVMSDFYQGRYQVLLATNIVESGLDVPNANTLIIYKAEYFGLSQLYQLKGRVGRSKKRAYAYFMTALEHSSQSKAYRRLEVIQSLDKLGAGFMVASHDMDLRGSGNLVGKAQSGHVKEVGYELYQELLKEAIEKVQAQKQNESDESGQKNNQNFSPRLNLGMPVFIPSEYVPDLSVRMGLYRRLSDIQTEEEVNAFLEELVDRFGEVPPPVKNLVSSIHLKILCRALNIEKIDRGSKAVVLAFYQGQPSNPEQLIDFASKNRVRVQLKPDGKLLFLRAFESDEEVITGIRSFLEELSHS